MPAKETIVSFKFYNTCWGFLPTRQCICNSCFTNSILLVFYFLLVNYFAARGVKIKHVVNELL